MLHLLPGGVKVTRHSHCQVSLAQSLPSETSTIFPKRLGKLIPNKIGTIVPTGDWHDCSQVDFDFLFLFT